jgi:spore germination cell wall hydrolase CwlJ-like protein
MRMSTILGGVASSAVIVAMAVVYLTADEAVAAVDPKETVYIDRIIEVEVERVVHVPVPPQPRAQTVIEAVSDEDRKCLAKNIYFEARGESQVGQAAVAWVTLNRVAASEFPTNICAVVWQSSQFSWTHDGKSDRPRDPVAWATAQAIAAEVIDAYGVDRDPTEGATYFHADSVRPGWSRKFNRVVQIDGHIFYSKG